MLREQLEGACVADKKLSSDVVVLVWDYRIRKLLMD